MSKTRLLSSIYGITAILAAWQAAAAVLAQPIVPAPAAVLTKLAAIFVSDIAPHSLFSLWRIAAGVCLAVIAGLPAGLCMGYFDRCDRALAPIVYLSYPVPKIALLPLLMLTLGIGEASKIAMIVLIIVFQVIVSVRDCIKSIPQETYYPLYSLGAGFAAILRHVLLPAALPQFLTSLRIAMATAVSVLFFTETFGTEYGMGFFIIDAWMRVDYPEMYAGILVLSLLGLSLFSLIDWLEKKLCRWQCR
ncbi:MAG: ABC transporter permease [Sporomusaceae bacterium]|nr:ABC transporter permease [Sporomusaceae bacterium]